MTKGIRTFLIGVMMATGLHGMAQSADSLSCSQRYNVLFLDAMLQRQKGNDDAAFDLLQRCVAIRPDASEAYFFLAQYYVKKKDQQLCVGILPEGGALNAENVIYTETLAQLYISQNLYAEATEVVAASMRSTRTATTCWNCCIDCTYQQQDYDNAIRMLERMEAIDGKSERLSYAKSELVHPQD